MDKEQNVSTHDTGAESEKEEQATQDHEKQDTKDEQGRSIPYARFQEVNSQKKQAEQQLEAACETMAQQIPVNYRLLIPQGLSCGERLEWIHNAIKSGIFNGKAPTDSPDSKRPMPPKDVDLNSMSPHELMLHSFKQ